MLRPVRASVVALLVFLAAACSPAQTITIRELPSTPRAVSELKRGWADAVIGDYPVMAHAARESMGTLEVAGTQFATGLFGIGVSKEAPLLRDAITDALRKTMADQTYVGILRTWALHIGKVEPPAAPASVAVAADVPQLKDGKLHVGMEMAFAPMEYKDELKKPAGADVELAQALGKALGVEVELIDMEFDALIAAVKSGQVDVVISAMTITPERSAQLDFVPYLEMGSGVLVVMGNPKRVSRPESLCGKTVAVQAGTSQIDAVKQIRCE